MSETFWCDDVALKRVLPDVTSANTQRVTSPEVRGLLQK